MKDKGSTCHGGSDRHSFCTSASADSGIRSTQLRSHALPSLRAERVTRRTSRVKSSLPPGPDEPPTGGIIPNLIVINDEGACREGLGSFEGKNLHVFLFNFSCVRGANTNNTCTTKCPELKQEHHMYIKKSPKTCQNVRTKHKKRSNKESNKLWVGEKRSSCTVVRPKFHPKNSSTAA